MDLVAHSGDLRGSIGSNLASFAFLLDQLVSLSFVDISSVWLDLAYQCFCC